MSRFTRFEPIEDPFYYTPPFFVEETSIFTPRTLIFPSFVDEDLNDGFILDLFKPCKLSSPFRAVDRVRAHHTPSFRCQRVERQLGKYTWTAEIEGPEKYGFDRKYKWVTEIVGEEKKNKNKKEKEKCGIAKNFKWTAEIKGKGQDSGSSRKYTLEVKSGDGGKKDKKKESELRNLEIEVPTEHKPVVLRQALAKRHGTVQSNRGKRKELSPQDAALLIQHNFRTYLIRRSKALRALRELAVAKSRLREIGAQFKNFEFWHHTARDADELQRFTEKIAVLLLTVDAIEGADFLIRSAKRSMMDELEAMLDVVDPQPCGRSLSIKRRTFTLPDGVI